MNRTVIRVEGLSKRYQLGTIGYGSLQRDLQSLWARVRGKEDPNTRVGETSRLGRHGDFWALSDIGFEVEKGDRVGIIGRNGAGKSTLLKLLSRVTSPTLGTIRVRGRIASLLEVGTGFHPELTGRENVFLNGAILGMKRREIQEKFDEIVGFAGVEQFIDTPVKRYSSGMYVRLAFSVAAHLDSDILVIDEVLAVGDVEFQKKCLGKMDAVSRGEGRTILFVSHQLPTILSLCNKGVFLENGRVNLEGPIDQCVERYLVSNKQARSGWAGSAIRKDYLEVTEMGLYQKNGTPVKGYANVDTPILLRFAFTLDRMILDLTVGFILFNYNHDPIYRSLTTDINSALNRQFSPGRNVLQCDVPIGFLESGTYYVGLHFSIGSSVWIINPSEDRDAELTVELQNTKFSSAHYTHGAIAPTVNWEVLKPESALHQGTK